jgi:hypothetical protein
MKGAFRMQCAKIVPNGEMDKLKEVDEGLLLTFINSYEYLQEIFHPSFNHPIIDHIERPLSFTWFEHPWDDNSERPKKEYCHDPMEVRDCIEEVLRAIEENSDRLPTYYWFLKSNYGFGSTTGRIMHEEKKFKLQGGLGRCYAEHVTCEYQAETSERMDLKDKKQLECYDVIAEPDAHEKRNLVQGEKIIVNIRRNSMNEQYSFLIQCMRRLAERAIDHDYLLFTKIE